MIFDKVPLDERIQYIKQQRTELEAGLCRGVLVYTLASTRAGVSEKHHGC